MAAALADALAGALAAGAVTAPAAAQAASPWATLAVPTGVAPMQATSQGKLCVYRDGNTLHVHSAVTRRWHTAPASSQAAMRLNNDCLLVQDGGTWTAFSAYRGTFAPLAVSASAQLVNPLGAVNDSLVLVADNGQVHAFSAFVGAWTTRPVVPGSQVVVQRHVAVLAQGALLSGLDAATNTWTDHAVAVPPLVLSADGTAGCAFGAGAIHAFSATHRTWLDDVQPTNATFTRADDWLLWHSPTRVLGYSSVRARFARGPHGAAATIAAQDLFALLDTANGIVAFSAITGAFSAPLAASGAAVTASTAVALLVDANGAVGYSALLGRGARRASVGAANGAANVVAWVADPTGAPQFFSALTGRWYTPPTPVALVDPTLTTTAAASPTTTGCLAFSPRTGEFVPLGDPTATLTGSPSSAPLLALGATWLHAFDARTDRWVSTPRTAPATPLAPMVWRTAAVVIDGGVAHGFGAAAGTWASQALPGPLVASRANSESVRLCTAQHVLAWSAVPEIAWLAQFPEFRRVQPAEREAPLVVAVPPGGVGVLGLGALASAPLPLPGLGELLLGPTSFGTVVLTAPASGAPVHVTLPAPAQPPLLGRELAAQAALWPPGGNPYLTEVATVMPL